jgi:Putative metal-binding motif
MKKGIFSIIMLFALVVSVTLTGCNDEQGSEGGCASPYDPRCRLCGDGKCTAGESAESCPQDCIDGCGDGVCQSPETQTSCPADCDETNNANNTNNVTAVCGNDACEAGESQLSCPADCNGTCGDGVCQSDESLVDCPHDCGECISGSTRLCGVSNLGVCSYGQQSCDDGTWGACEEATVPADNEVCDGLDNDCDGLVDNGPSCPCKIDSVRTCGSNTGMCQQGLQYCVDDGDGNAIWDVVCIGEVGHEVEICDGLDNDCNGVADDGVGCQCSPTSTRVCGSAVGECQPGMQICTVGGVWDGICVGEVGPSFEICDHLDNDCNGTIDEAIGCNCSPGETRVCGSGIGECQTGEQTCTAGGTWDATCVGSTGPVTEICDNLDNDCNGVPDDSVGCQCNPGESRTCGSGIGQCRPGMQTCDSNGIWGGVCVGETLPINELCDSLDNNCNGTVDEGAGCDCKPGSTRACGSSTGTCEPGLQACSSAGIWGDCVGEVGPTNETCDNLDNNCNALVDEGVGCQCNPGESRTCGSGIGQCRPGMQTCDPNGIWGGVCVGEVLPSSELCDNLDNDCNGTVDEGAGCQCVPSEERPCGSSVGSCVQGLQACSPAGIWGDCVGEVGPTNETCDNLDNNCNALVDEGVGCQCNPGESRTCGSGIGQCRPGMQTCDPNGIWGGVCTGEVIPTAETCDNLDNNCNGVADEGVGCSCQPGSTRVCGSGVGECQTGEQTCTSAGIWGSTCVGAVAPVDEICDNLDNDCNGTPDDAILCACQPGSTRICGSSEGQCRAGMQTCQSDFTWNICTGVVWPTDEVCNNLDDDCDGVADNDIVCQCEPGSIRTCGSNQGACSLGTQTCQSDRTWGSCSGDIGPTDEVCDGFDNDCNGVADDAIMCQCQVGSTKVCGSSKGTCGTGVQTCLLDGVTNETYWSSACTGEVLPVAEVCDGLDNDCNGSADDGILCQCPVGSTRLCDSNVGECVSGVQTCVLVGSETQWGVCAGATGPNPEICDNLDNDCNGVPDDSVGCQCNPGESRACGSNIGSCAPGLQTCTSAGVWGSICVGDVGPGTEVCDGLDNDCNGVVDDGRSCQCQIGSTRVCGASQGTCSQGVQTCVLDGGTGDSYWSGTCVGEVLPSTEICDGLDNDCNGSVDEECQCNPGESRVCGSSAGECIPGAQICTSAGVWGACSGNTGPAAYETCDGLDNDCNGLIDEGIACQCQSGDQRPCGSSVGECVMGIQDCVSDGSNGFVWGGTCTGEALPTSETCDNLDNDCNGVSDDNAGCQCIPGESRPCGSGVGECSPGLQTCNSSGIWGSVCSGDVLPSDEICDGLDNNCNGVADDAILCACIAGSTRTCESGIGECVQGVQTCLTDSSGYTYWDSICAGSTGPSGEVCDGFDNDCNGAVDEGCQCSPGSMRICGSSIGQCSFGVQTCTTSGVWSATCSGMVGPFAEICDGVDNDCNGSIDEGCQCLNSSTRACGSGTGECSPGLQTCTSGVWGICAGEAGPSPDGPGACDGLDNDCNGIIDDTCGCVDGDTQSCGISQGECSQGTTTCSGGVWGMCIGYIGPVAEVCGNLLDENCNGVADDPGVCAGGGVPGSENCINGVDDDGNGLIDCADPGCAADPACGGGGAEICTDGIDNDADGFFDCVDNACQGDAACSNYLNECAIGDTAGMACFPGFGKSCGASGECAQYDTDGDTRLDCVCR